jgi:anaerobic magnesium-protoporphyrin IX monomethyl ester cyclase
MDLLLISPGNRSEIYQSLGASIAAVEPPVWAGLMATYVRSRGYSVQILDANAEQLSPAATAERVAACGPTLAAIVVYGQQPSASTQVMPSAGAICRAIKERAPQIRTLLVGGHVAALPERTVEEECADFVCSGEGPVTLVELIEALRSGSTPALDNVRGLWYREAGGGSAGWRARSTPPAPLVRDLDTEMPGVAWDLLPIARYRAHNWHCFGHLNREPYAAIYTTLGCPYHCSFCCIQAPFKSGESLLGYRESVNSYRFWSVASVIAQIETLVERYGVRNIKFADEMFVLNARHVDGICDAIIERGYDLNIWAYARVDTIRGEATLEKLKKAGFQWLAFGLEAGSERVRNDINKRFDADQIDRIVRKVQEAGINVIGNYIFGLPEDDRESMQETLDMALALNCEFANFYCAMAYPGSPLYRQALAYGWPLPETWSGYSQHSEDSLPLPTKYLTAGEVLKFRDHAFHVYFSSRNYLDLVARKFGAETIRHIEQMASHRLVRRYAG